MWSVGVGNGRHANTARQAGETSSWVFHFNHRRLNDGNIPFICARMGYSAKGVDFNMSNRIEEMALMVAVVDSGSLSAAARQTGLSLSSVSRQLTALEERLQTRLLVRSTRGLALTDAGQGYYLASKRLLAEVDEVEASLTATAATPVGRLRVTAPTLFGRVHVLPILAEFLALYEQVTLDVTLIDRPVSLLDEGVDLAVIVGEMENSNLVARRLGAIRWVMAAAPAYLARRGTPKHLDALLHHDCLNYTQLPATDDRWRLTEDGRERDVRINARMRSNTLDGAVAAALQGNGIVLTPAWAVADQVRTGNLRLLLRKYEAEPRPVFAVMTHGRLLATKVRVLLDFLADRLTSQRFDGA